MSNYKKYRLRPECVLVMFLGKLLSNQQTIGPTGNYVYVLKNTGHVIVMSPQWITESA